MVGLSEKFKIFRQDFFKKNVMVHFEVASALINAFHPPIVNRSDAQEIPQKKKMITICMWKID